VWVALLRVHSNLDDVDEGLLFQCIKDAHDNMSGAEMIKLPGFHYDQNDEKYDICTFDQRDGKDAPSGTKLAHYVNNRASEWKSLPTTKKVHLRGEPSIVGLTVPPRGEHVTIIYMTTLMIVMMGEGTVGMVVEDMAVDVEIVLSCKRGRETMRAKQ